MSKVLLLIVEDELMLANMYATKFKVDGFDVDIAHDGAEGFEKMRTDKPDLVLMDVIMPNLSGLQALEKAKTDPATKDIPIIMLTNLSGDTDVIRALKEGAAGFIVKSDQTPSEIVNKVSEILGKSKKSKES